MLVYTLKRAAGEISFAPSEVIELPESQVQALIDAGAIRIIEQAAVECVKDEPEQPVETEKPKRKRR
jgi:hypothetical protein